MTSGDNNELTTEADIKSVSSKHYYNLLKNEFFSLWVVKKPVHCLFKSLSIVKVPAIRFNGYNQKIKIFNTRFNASL